MSIKSSPQQDILMVSTDLDGTLLDHHTYSWEEARPALSVLRAKRIPILINTSKTISEVISLQDELEFNAPFIVENGSAMVFPASSMISPPSDVQTLDAKHSVKIFGVPRSEIVVQLRRLRETFSWRFEGFSDWDVSKVIDHTGLNMQGAEQALSRGFSEPIIWEDSNENFDLFTAAILDLNYKILRGGRFIHILGRTDKGVPLKWLSHYYKQKKIGNIKWIVLGDGRNDIDMLKMADYPVAVKSPVADFPQFTSKSVVTYTDEYGPLGWNRAVSGIFKKINL